MAVRSGTVIKTVFLTLAVFTITAGNSFSQNVTNDELLTILDIKAFRVPSFSKKQWTIDIIRDTLPKRKVVTIDKVLSSGTNSLIAVKFDNDTTITYTLIQNKDLSSQGVMSLKQPRYEIEWNKVPEHLFKNIFVIARINYEENDQNKTGNPTYLIVIELINELKFP